MSKCEDCVYDRAHSNLCDTCAEDGPENHFKAEFPETEPCQNCTRLKEFARQVIKEQCWGYEMDGLEIKDLAEKLELIAKHTATEDDVEDESDYEVGDTIYKFTEILKGNK